MAAAGIPVEQCLFMVKPNAEEQTDEIIRTLKKKGFTIIQSQRMQLTSAQASDFFAPERTRITFGEHVNSITSQPVTVMVCGKNDVVKSLNELCGPEDPTVAKESAPDSLRAQYGVDIIKNGVHASSSAEAAAAEIRLFFPRVKIEPVASVADTQAYLEENINPTLLSGLTQLCKEKPDRPVEWIAKWLLDNNPNQPKVAV